MAILIGGALAAPVLDTGGVRGFSCSMNKLLGIAVDERVRSAKGNARHLTPRDVEWWELLNDTFRRSNCLDIEYDALKFDLERARVRLGPVIL